MIQKTFPYRETSSSLESDDFQLFSASFQRLIKSSFPMEGQVHFVLPGDALPKLSADSIFGIRLASVYEQLVAKEKNSAIIANVILFAFSLTDDQTVVAIATGVDPVIANNGSEGWASEIGETLQQEFLRLKQAYKDPETGLLNSAHLFSLPDLTEFDEDMALVVVEVRSRTKDIQEVFYRTRRAASLLVAFTQCRLQLHHLGQAVFVLVATRHQITPIESFSARLVSFLKREGYYRVHVGSAAGTVAVDGGLQKLLDNGWTALQEAGKRGPFSFCDYTLLANGTEHPLRPQSQKLIQKVISLHKKDNQFCLMKLGCNPEDEQLNQWLMNQNFEDDISIIPSSDALFIYLSGYSSDRGLTYCSTLVKQFLDLQGMESVRGGMAAYPFLDFSPSETIVNSNKALLHAEFLDPGTVVQFDALSLNVSGDIYFSDGDLVRAVKEYNKGLKLNGEDLHLLNSLGVTYALMNKNSDARRAFEKILEIESSNYMALYNLGLGAQLGGEKLSAVKLFEKALQCNDESVEFSAIQKELTLQLGKLNCDLGNYHNALIYFDEWCDTATEMQQLQVRRYLGEACLATGRSREAMQHLERAMQYDEFDHKALSLLGIAIQQEGEGEEIAESLCRKAVELQPEDPLLRMRLAEVLLKTGQYAEGLVHLKLCRGKKILSEKVRLLKAEAYFGLGKLKRAGYWLAKIFCQQDVNKEVLQLARELQGNIE